MFVVERGGAIHLVLNGEKRDTPFLTIPSVETGGEAGLLSIAFPPDYATSGLFYVYLVPGDITPNAAPWEPIEIREYKRSMGDPNLADLGSARDVLTIDHSTQRNHWGGTHAVRPRRAPLRRDGRWGQRSERKRARHLQPARQGAALRPARG